MRRALLACLLLAGCAAAPAATPVAQAPASAPVRPTLGQGYLPRGEAPDSLLINPPPPAPGSAAEARDREAMEAALKLQPGPRFDLARVDADLFAPDATAVFSCAAQFPVRASSRIDALLRKSASDFAMAVYPTKTRYMRPRPFMANGKSVCTPEMDGVLRKDGSYPSGHAAIGYGWGLILAQLFPHRSAELVARGQAFGDSRRVCNVHWRSDIEQGQMVAAAVFARLQSEPGYQADIAAVREEMMRIRVAPPDAATCAKEAETLALG